MLILGKKEFFKLSFKRSGGKNTGYIRIQQIIRLWKKVENVLELILHNGKQKDWAFLVLYYYGFEYSLKRGPWIWKGVFVNKIKIPNWKEWISWSFKSLSSLK